VLFRSAIKFLEGLKDIMQKAPVGQKINYGNKYFSMYQEKYNSAKEEAQNKQIESAQNISLATSLTLGGLGTIAAFGLILVLLAIERNTRQD